MVSVGRRTIVTCGSRSGSLAISGGGGGASGSGSSFGGGAFCASAASANAKAMAGISVAGRRPIWHRDDQWWFILTGIGTSGPPLPFSRALQIEHPVALGARRLKGYVWLRPLANPGSLNLPEGRLACTVAANVVQPSATD